MNRNYKYVVASVGAGILTPVLLVALSWLTAQNFLAEGADTTLSRMFIAPIDWVSMSFYRILGISGWTSFFVTATTCIFALACFYYLVIRWVLGPFLRARRNA